MNDLYLIIGFTHTPWIGLGIGSILLAGSLLILSIPAYVIMLKLNEVFRLERKTKKPATKEERDTYRNGLVRNAFEDLIQTTLGIDITACPARSYTYDAIRYMQNQEVFIPFVKRQEPDTDFVSLPELADYLPWSEKNKEYRETILERERILISIIEDF